jgi:serine/threonine protein kinase
MCHHPKFGTIDYAAPEVFHGWLSDRTDQYALAVTYCHLRSGRLPFNDTPSSFREDFVRSAPDLSTLTPAERGVISRGLAPIPQDRWPSCSELISRVVQSLNPVATVAT